MKKKQAIILGSIFLLIVVVLLIALAYKSKQSGNKAEPTFKIEFMNDQEKSDLNLDPSTRAQVLERDPDGKAMTYKVINSDSDVVNSLEEVK